MAGLDAQLRDGPDGIRIRGADYIRARRHDVLNLHGIQGQDVQQHGPFFLIQLSFLTGVADGLLHGILVTAVENPD